MEEYELTYLALVEASGIREQVALTQTQLEIINFVGVAQITIIFGYVVAAYLVGAALSKVQVSILNGLYLWFSSLNMFFVFSAHAAGRFQYAELLVIDPDRGVPMFWTPETAYFMLISNFIVIGFSFWFMRDIRKHGEKIKSV